MGFFFLTIAFLAGLFTMLAAYERAKIQRILTPRGKETYRSRLLLGLTVLVFAVVLVGSLSPLITGPFLNSLIGGISILGALGLALLCGSLAALTRPELPRRLIYLLAGASLIISLVILFGYYVIDYNSPLDASFVGGGTTIETAKGLLIANIGVFLAFRRGLKSWFVRIILATGIMFTVILDLVAYFIHHPVFLPNSVAICFVLISILQFWLTLKTE